MAYFLIAGAAVGLILIRLVLGFRKERHRKALLAQPFPPSWKALLEAKSSLYVSLPPQFKDELHGLIQIFLDEKRFEGCGGLVVTEEMKVLIAAQACLLLVNNQETERKALYPTLSTILVYPSAYVAPERAAIGFNQVIETDEARLGESWNRGSVILVWDHVSEDSQNPAEGENVVLHEFAHQLDQEDSSSNGAPLLKTRGQYIAWARVLGGEYKRLQDELAKNHPTLLREYAATNPAEFFAVVTEVFFEKPGVMKRRHPELYEQLQGYYGLDPAQWAGAIG